MATHLLCEHVIAVAQMRGMGLADEYDPAEILPGRAVKLEHLTAAREAIEEMTNSWKGTQ